jgi:hypothetical protein
MRVLLVIALRLRQILSSSLRLYFPPLLLLHDTLASLLNGEAIPSFRWLEAGFACHAALDMDSDD